MVACSGEAPNLESLSTSGNLVAPSTTPTQRLQPTESTGAPEDTAPMSTGGAVDCWDASGFATSRDSYEKKLSEYPLPENFVFISVADALFGESFYFHQFSPFWNSNEYRYCFKDHEEYGDSKWIAVLKVQHISPEDWMERYDSFRVLNFSEVTDDFLHINDEEALSEIYPRIINRDGVMYEYSLGSLYSVSWYIDGCLVEVDLNHWKADSRGDLWGNNNDFLPGGERYDEDAWLCRILSQDPELFASAVAEIEALFGTEIEETALTPLSKP